MSALWTGAEIASATGAQVGPIMVNGVSIDSRTLQKGDLFVALHDQRDGHDYVGAALANGAAAALVSRVNPDVPRAGQIVVPDTLTALNQLAQAARARIAGKVIAVTGSVGKTGTKEMLRSILGAQGQVHAAEKSYNNHWGVPLTLARMPRDTDFAVIEIGMNHPGEIAPLAKLAQSDVALITTVAAVHAAAFADVDAIAREKAAIFQGLVPGGTAVLPADCTVYPLLLAAAIHAKARILRFGAKTQSEFLLIKTHVTPAATVVQADGPEGEFLFKLGAPGWHLVQNALGALAAAYAAGADLARAALALAQWHAPEGRGARFGIALGPGGLDGQIALIDESYNANPTSMGAALDLLAMAPVQDGVGRVSFGRRIAFLGDMLELGADTRTVHAGLAQHPSIADISLVHCIGPLMASLYAALPVEKRGRTYATAEDCAADIARLLDAGDVVMAKGSFGSRMRIVVDAIKNMGECSPLDQA